MTWIFRLFFEPLFLLLGMRKRREEASLSDLGCILVVRLDEIGDVVMTTPFLRELRRNCPRAWITLVVKPGVYNLVEPCPYVNEVLTCDWNVHGRAPTTRRVWRMLRLACRSLWKRRFDLVVLPRWARDYYHASFLAYLSGARIRAAYSSCVTPEKARENRGYDRLFTRLLTDNAPRHEVERSLRMLVFIGGSVHSDKMELWPQPGDRDAARALIGSDLPVRRPLLIGIGLGARETKRIWPAECFKNLIEWLIAKKGVRVVLLGDSSEARLASPPEGAVTAGPGDAIINCVGRTTLREAAAVLERCALYVGNDTGLMHIAAAVGIPVVEISCWSQGGPVEGDRSPHRYGPWGVRHAVVGPEKSLSPCAGECTRNEPHCILQVPVEAVQKAVEEILCPR
jgi:heptosyltransferase-2